MSFGPESQPGDLEELAWCRVPSQLRGVAVKSLVELDALVRRQGKEYEAGIKVGGYKGQSRYLTYTMNEGNGLIAYHCPGCQKIVVGPPTIKNDTSIKDGHPLAGREGYDVYCSKCEYPLDEATFALS